MGPLLASSLRAGCYHSTQLVALAGMHSKT